MLTLKDLKKDVRDAIYAELIELQETTGMSAVWLSQWLEEEKGITASPDAIYKGFTRRGRFVSVSASPRASVKVTVDSTPTITYDGIHLRPCRNRDCGEAFIPLNPSHWYHEPACAEVDAERKRSVREVLSLEAGMDGDSLELAKAAFGQKNILLRKVHKLQSMRDYLTYEIQDYLDSNPERRYSVEAPPATESKKASRTIVLDCGDWQVGKLENGIGVEVMERQRIPRIIDATLAVAKTFRDSGYAVNDLVINFGGDQVEGCFIYRGQSLSGLDRTDNTHYLTRQVMKAAQLQAGLVAALAEHFARVRVYVVRGNHGRVGTATDFADPEDNWDTLSAEWSKTLTAGIDHVSWHISHDWWVGFDVEGHYVVSFHGDNWTGNFSKLENLLPGWVLANVFKATPDLVLTHHRHDFMTMRVGGIQVIQSGTIDGGSNWYLRAFGKSSAPEQSILVMSKEYSPEAVFPIKF